MEENTKKFNIWGWFEKKTGAPVKTSQKVFIIVLLVVFLFVFYVMLDANKYRAMVHVIEGKGAVGVNPTTESLDFGDLSPGTSAVRRVSIENGTFMPMYIAVVQIGRISDLIELNKNNFKLGAGESTKIDFTLYMPASGEIGGDYRGRVYLFKVPTFGI